MSEPPSSRWGLITMLRATTGAVRGRLPVIRSISSPGRPTLAASPSSRATRTSSTRRHSQAPGLPSGSTSATTRRGSGTEGTGTGFLVYRLQSRASASVAVTGLDGAVSAKLFALRRTRDRRRLPAIGADATYSSSTIPGFPVGPWANVSPHVSCPGSPRPSGCRTGRPDGRRRRQESNPPDGEHPSHSF